MAKSNRQRIEEALDLVADGFGPFVDDQMKVRYGDDWISEVSAKDKWSDSKGGKKGNLSDPDFLLWVATFEWQSVFRKILSRSDRGLFDSLRDARNKWAHKEGFTTDDAYRALDAAFLLLTSVGAQEADVLDVMKTEVMREKFEAQTRKTVKTADAGQAVEGLPAWRDVVQPHDDVATGEFSRAEFAADLHKVHQGKGLPEYTDPVEFFKRTYLTGGLSKLLVHTAKRMAGKGGDPIVDLLTQFGGGKTHSLLGVYHLCSGTDISELLGVQELLAEAGIDSLPKDIKRVVLVGNRLSPGRIDEKPDGTKVHTLWGELAWQLGGREAYDLLEGTDANHTNPGDRLDVIFEEFGPAVILVDEWVAYARQLWDRTDLPAGDFETHMSFAQALTEAAKTDGILLAVSIPASDIEVGGPAGQDALERIRKVVERSDSPWQPASADEGFEIVRRRLFKTLDADGYKHRDATARKFRDFYDAESSEFPSDCRQPGYEERIKSAYPIHPELFDRLYQDWSTLERFQRTRGVLRLMAGVVHALWQSGDRSPLIMPGNIPIDDSTVFDEVTRHLEQNWRPVVDRDVDGPHSVPMALDRDIPALGKHMAARRVARAVFMGSAPTVQKRTSEGTTVANPNRGIEDTRIKLGVAVPGESPAVFGDALRRLSDRASHLYVDSSRYWYATNPSINRVAQDRADRYSEDDVIEDLIRRIRSENTDTGAFARIHVMPDSSGDVADVDEAGLVILRPTNTHARGKTDSSAITDALSILKERGHTPRTYQNMLVFLATDHQRLPELLDAVRQFKAWSSVLAEKGELNLDQHGVTQAETKKREAEDAVRQRINETYCWMLAPTQDLTGPVEMTAVKINSQGTLAQRVSKKAEQDNTLITMYGPTALRLELDRVPLWRGNHVSVKQAWEDFASRPYLPRLRDMKVFLRAVEGGPATLDAKHDGFGYAESYDEKADRYRGLVLHAGVHSPVADGSSVLIKPDIASEQKREATAAEKPQPGSDTTGGQSTDPTPTPPGSEPTPDDDESSSIGPLPSRFYGRVELDSGRVARDAGQLAQEVIAHLVGLGADVKVTVEIEADYGDGFETSVQRIVGENARTLGFDAQEFE